MPIEIRDDVEAQYGHLREEGEQLHPPRDPSSTTAEPNEEAVHTELASVDEEAHNVETMTDPLVEVHLSDCATMERVVVFGMVIDSTNQGSRLILSSSKKPPLFEVIERRVLTEQT